MAENKTKPRKASVKKFIAGVDNKRRQADAHVLLEMFSEMLPSSLPVVVEVTDSVGASATASTWTSMVALVDAESVVTVVSLLVGFVSEAVAVTVS